jgi:transposase InsO family protein
MPKAITVDNGTQLDAKTFKTFFSQIGRKIHFTSVRHPKSNGLVERANRIIITGIMKSIFNQPKGKWSDCNTQNCIQGIYKGLLILCAIISS